MAFSVNLVVSAFIWKSGIDFLTNRFYTALAICRRRILKNFGCAVAPNGIRCGYEKSTPLPP